MLFNDTQELPHLCTSFCKLVSKASTKASRSACNDSDLALEGLEISLSLHGYELDEILMRNDLVSNCDYISTLIYTRLSRVLALRSF